MEGRAYRSEEDCRARLAEAGGGMERIRSWFNQRTFNPERLADSAVNDWALVLWQRIDTLRENGADEETVSLWADAFVRKWLAFQHAGSRTLNWMITGPARFPVERNEKRMATERKRYDELDWFVGNCENWLRRRQNAAKRAEASVQAKESGSEFQTSELCGVKLVHNTAIDRVQLVFPGKPDPETIRDLKSSAFRWSPREGAWQRQLTRNGIWAANGVLAALAERQAS